MNPLSWHLEPHAAQLRIGFLGASLNLRCPAAGLTDWRGLGEPVAAIGILAVEAPAFRLGDPVAPVDAYLRGPDLIAIYRERSDWPVTLHAQWRALPAEEPAGVLGAVELTLSVRTERLEARPELCVCSRLPPGEVLCLSDADAAETGRANHVLARPGQATWSYAEMASPADFGGSEAVPPADPAGLVVLRHRLFARRLEKGVLLRTRVRGVFLPRQDDVRLATELSCRFARMDPPLGV